MSEEVPLMNENAAINSTQQVQVTQIASLVLIFL